MHTTPRQTIARHIAKVNPPIARNAKTVREMEKNRDIVIAIDCPDFYEMPPQELLSTDLTWQ